MSIAIWLPIGQAELSFLEGVLRNADVLLTGNYEGKDPYALTDYHVASNVDGLQFRALFDRNVVSPLVSLARGDRVPESLEAAKATRLAAACACFCILAEIQVEPSIAVYEHASLSGNAVGQADAMLFRLADNSDPRAYLDIAMGRADSLPVNQLEHLRENTDLLHEQPRERDFERKLRMWKVNYLFALKTVSLRRSGLNPFDAAMALTKWQANEAFFSAVACTYCVAAIAHSPPRGGMLKGILSAAPDTVRAGARNAAWDMSLLQLFGRNAGKSGGECWGLWSLDRALMQTARYLFVRGDESAEKILGAFYAQHWGVRDGRRLLTTYQECSVAVGIGSSARIERVGATLQQIDHEIAKLELGLGVLSGAS